jgi:hypothetical protein
MVFEPREHGADDGDLLLDRRDEGIHRRAAREVGQAAGGEERAQFLGVGGPGVALLDPVEPDLASGLVKGLLGGGMGADGLVVVIAPCDGIGPEADYVSLCLATCWK